MANATHQENGQETGNSLEAMEIDDLLDLSSLAGAVNDISDENPEPGDIPSEESLRASRATPNLLAQEGEHDWAAQATWTEDDTSQQEALQSLTQSIQDLEELIELTAASASLRATPVSRNDQGPAPAAHDGLQTPQDDEEIDQLTVLLIDTFRMVNLRAKV